MRDSEFDFIRTLVYERSRINLGADKRELVSARLGKRLRATQTADIGEYCDLLRSPGAGEELSHLIDVISTNHTFFFRENAHFDFVRSVAVPEMLARSRTERWPRFHAWSAACSSGEEPYSLAITLAESLAGTSWPWQIEATDISHRILDRAAAGIYRDDVVQKMPAATVRQYFQKGHGPQAGNYRVRRELMAGVRFHQLNLLEGEPPATEPFQIVFCRNVMIYFDRPTQERLVGKFFKYLKPGGHLFIGHSESLQWVTHSFKTLAPTIYWKEG